MTQLVRMVSSTLPALITAAGDRSAVRFLEFFTANIRNPHTRRAYARAAEECLAWCAAAGVASIPTQLYDQRREELTIDEGRADRDLRLLSAPYSIAP